MESSLAPVHLDAAAPQGSPPHYCGLPVIGGWNGSSTLAWHMLVPAGESGDAYALGHSDEVVALLGGTGEAVHAGRSVQVRAGHCWLTPSGTPRFFRNTSRTEAAVLVGFWPGAPDFGAAGCRALERAGGADSSFAPSGGPGPIMVHLENVPAERMDAAKGWSISDFRLPLGRHNGSSSTLFRARFLPGAVHRKHRHERCEEIYYVISGHGLAGAGGSKSEVRGGHFHHIPAGVEHWLVNHDPDVPVEVVGIYVGAGSVDDTGYAYCGDVTAADLE